MKFANFVVRLRYVFLVLFVCLAVAGVFFIGKTKVNYDMKKYLPEDSDTNLSLGILENEGFGYTCMMNVMLKGDSVARAEALAALLQSELNDGEARVSLVSLKRKGENVLLQIAINGDEYSDNAEYVADMVPQLLEGENFVASGGVVMNRNLAAVIAHEIPIILGVCVAIVLVILLATSSSWIDALLFFIVIGVSALINMGTNFIFGTISYITQSVAVILQLALAMDYSIILLNNYNERIAEGLDPKSAVTQALANSFKSVSSSCLTTVAGLIALLFMTFTIGFDIGLVLSKGVVISMISVFLLMPSLILIFNKPLAKTRHKQLMLPTKRLSKFAFSSRKVVTLAVVAVIAVGAVLSIGYNTYSFNVNMEGNDESTEIAEVFGQNNMFMVLFEKGDAQTNLSRQRALTEFVNAYPAFKNDDGENRDVTVVYSPVVGYTVDELVDMLQVDGNMIEKLYWFMGKSGQAVSIAEISAFVSANIPNGILNIMLTPEKLALLSEIEVSQVQSYFNISEYGEQVSLIKLVEDLQDVEWRLTMERFFAVLHTDPAPLFALADEIWSQREELAAVDVAAMIAGGMSMFESENFCRMMFVLDVQPAEQKTFDFLSALEKMLSADEFEGTQAYLAGESAVFYDVAKAFRSDLTKTTCITIGCVLLIIGLTFLSLSMPLLLVFIIQGAIWIGMSFSAMFSAPIFFMSYIIVSCILMGATIDYGILLSSTYVKNRELFGKRDAVAAALKTAMPTVFTSGSIMTVAGLCVGLFSTVEAISSVGLLLARGTVISVIMVMVVLPALLLVFDKLIGKTTRHKQPFALEEEKKLEIVGR